MTFTQALADLGFESYGAYLASDQWRLTRAQALAHRRRCEVCHYGARLEVHHRTYERLGDERPADLVVLCSRCHRRTHDYVKGGAKLATAHKNVAKNMRKREPQRQGNTADQREAKRRQVNAKIHAKIVRDNQEAQARTQRASAKQRRRVDRAAGRRLKNAGGAKVLEAEVLELVRQRAPYTPASYDRGEAAQRLARAGVIQRTRRGYVLTPTLGVADDSRHD